MKAFFNNLQKYIPVSKKLEEAISNIAKVEKLPARHHLLKEGNICFRLYFLLEGTARTYSYEDGKDVTSWIYPEEIHFTSWGSFLGQSASIEYIELLEPSVVVSFSYDELEKLYDQFPKLERFGRKLVETQLVFIDEFSRGYLFMSANKRYELLLSFFPDVEQRIKLGHIASFLGISQETLSRIRKKR